MFGLVKQSTLDKLEDEFEAVCDESLAFEIENIHLKAKLKTYEIVNKPYKGKDGRWRNSSTQQFVKAPDPIREEAKAKRAKADAAYKRLNVKA